ncbi:hypothetical protein [Shinella sp.]|uniref:hypothetical protein n=1 Tax=Shinella sp. TaxID=1870904 RepID=UPI003F720D22
MLAEQRALTIRFPGEDHLDDLRVLGKRCADSVAHPQLELAGRLEATTQPDTLSPRKPLWLVVEIAS